MIQIDLINGAYEVIVSGRIDTGNAPEVEKELEPITQILNVKVTMDCSSLQYISSSGLRVFLSFHKKINAQGGTLVLKNIVANVREIFDMTGFTRIFTIQ